MKGRQACVEFERRFVDEFSRPRARHHPAHLDFVTFWTLSEKESAQSDPNVGQPPQPHHSLSPVSSLLGSGRSLAGATPTVLVSD